MHVATTRCCHWYTHNVCVALNINTAILVTRLFLFVTACLTACCPQARDAALAALDDLQAQCASPDAALVQQAGSCSRCRAETGVRGRVCVHCRLDERFMEWEMVLYFIRVKSMQQGKQVTMREALAQRHVQALKRVGQGGLNEEGMEQALAATGA